VKLVMFIGFGRDRGHVVLEIGNEKNGPIADIFEPRS
jgi:hypothetical protein